MALKNKLIIAANKRAGAYYEVDAHDGDITALAFEPLGAEVVTAGRDNWVRFWSMKDSSLSREWPGPDHPLEDLDFSPDGLFMAGACMDGNIYIWDVVKEEIITTLAGHEEIVVGVTVFSRRIKDSSASYDGTGSGVEC